MQQTLPKSIILRGYQSFSNVITGGVSFQGTVLTGFLLTVPGAENFEIGFSVPKKRVPLAADRNRIRRLMREAVRKQVWETVSDPGKKTAGVRIVLMYQGVKNKPARRLTLHEIEQSWLEIRRQILKAL